MSQDNRPGITRNFTKVPNFLLQRDCLLTPHERLIYMYLLKSPECFAGQLTIGKELGLSRASVQRSLSRMIEHGVVEKQQRVGWSVTYIPKATKHWRFDEASVCSTELQSPVSNLG